MGTPARRLALIAFLFVLLCPLFAGRIHDAAVTLSHGAPNWSYDRMAESVEGDELRQLRMLQVLELTVTLLALPLLALAGLLLVRNPPLAGAVNREFPVPLDGFKPAILRAKSLLSSYALWVDGAPARLGSAKRSYLLPREDGSEAEVRLVGNPFDIPQVSVGDQVARVVPALNAGQWVLIVLPLVLIMGGAIGGGLGGAAAALNTRLVRADLPSPLGLLMALCAIGLAFAAYSQIALLFVSR